MTNAALPAHYHRANRVAIEARWVTMVVYSGGQFDVTQAALCSIDDRQDDMTEAPGQMTDRELLAAYQRTNGEPGEPEADALLAEIERRNLDL